MATRTLDQLTTEVYARGFDYLPQSRVWLFINGSIAELSEAFPWPFLESTYTGAAPVNMGALAGSNYARSVMTVNDVTTGQSIEYVERAALAQSSVNFNQTTSGAPDYWYWQGTTLKTWPVTTAQINVEYVGAAPELTTGTDSISGPLIFHDLIVDGAVIRALADSDNYAEVQALRIEWDRRIQSLVSSYGNRQTEPRYIVVTDAEWNS